MKSKFLSCLMLLAFCACKTDKKTKTENTKGAKMTATAKADEWIPLFDGTSTVGWRAFRGTTLPQRWVIKDSMLTFDTEMELEKEEKGNNSIVYGAEMFDNFELYVEWMVSEGGNSGIHYHLQEVSEYMSVIAPEYQMLDDLKWEEINNTKLEAWQKTGADYAMYAPDERVKIVKPAMQWNTTRIIFTPQKVEHWLNGVKLLEFTPWSEDWERRKKESKWKDHPKYGTFKTGYIAIQDHNSPLWFKNIKIKKL